MCAFIQSLDKYLFSTYYVLSTVIGWGHNSAQDKVLAFYIIAGMIAINQ